MIWLDDATVALRPVGTDGAVVSVVGVDVPPPLPLLTVMALAPISTVLSFTFTVHTPLVLLALAEAFVQPTSRSTTNSAAGSDSTL
ncbi:hypothetical protein D3C83_95140 [compost metagenome]